MQRKLGQGMNMEKPQTVTVRRIAWKHCSSFVCPHDPRVGGHLTERRRGANTELRSWCHALRQAYAHAPVGELDDAANRRALLVVPLTRSGQDAVEADSSRLRVGKEGAQAFLLLGSERHKAHTMQKGGPHQAQGAPRPRVSRATNS